jgi:hypothetical protein
MKKLEANKESFETIKESLSKMVPFCEVSLAAIGKDSIMLLVSFNPKESWSYGYVMN